MRNSLTLGQERIRTLVKTMIDYGVVCQTAADGELLLELYSLLECLEPEENEVAERLSKLRFVPTRTVDLGLYLVYIPLPDVLAHLLPVSTLPEAQAWRRWLATTGLPTQADLAHLCVGLPMTRSLDE